MIESWQPIVSIVTPSYNQARFLRQAVESVLAQDYKHLEYLVLDGGSTDESVEIIRNHQQRLAHWESGPDNGQADAINRGWQRSQGEILAWLNSDDTYEPSAVSAVMEVFRRHPEVDVVTGDCQVIDEKGRIVYSLPSGDLNIHAILAGNSLPQQGVFCRRTAVEAAGWLNAELRLVFDWALWLKLGLRGVRFYHLRRTLANFRVWGHSKTVSDTIGASLSGGVQFARERLVVLEKLLETPNVTDTVQQVRLLRTALLANLLELVLLHQIAGDPTEEAYYLDRLVKVWPDSLRSLPYPQALAAHLAYLDGDDDLAIEHFIATLSSSLIKGGLTPHPAKWRKALYVETHLVQAWHATHLSDDFLALKNFLAAIMANPEVVLQRRVLSPTVKLILKLPVLRRGRDHKGTRLAE